jgi:hypothetical protein
MKKKLLTPIPSALVSELWTGAERAQVLSSPYSDVAEGQEGAIRTRFFDGETLIGYGVEIAGKFVRTHAHPITVEETREVFLEVDRVKLIYA